MHSPVCTRHSLSVLSAEPVSRKVLVAVLRISSRAREGEGQGELTIDVDGPNGAVMPVVGP